LNAEKSVGGHVKKSTTLLFLKESNFVWQLTVEHFKQYNFRLKCLTVVEKSAKNFKRLLYFAAPCMSANCIYTYLYVQGAAKK